MLHRHMKVTNVGPGDCYRTDPILIEYGEIRTVEDANLEYGPTAVIVMFKDGSKMKVEGTLKDFEGRN